MDNLNDNERILAWKASWHPSFAGIAVVNKDFTFRSVNPQFCKLLGVTPAELLGLKFQDVTHPNIREMDERNAQLLIDGSVDFYLLPKTYQFSSGRTVDVILMVTRAPKTGDFQFFLSRIMLNQNGELLTSAEQLKSDTFYQKLTEMAVGFLTKYYKWIIGGGGATVILKFLGLTPYV